MEEGSSDRGVCGLSACARAYSAFLEELVQADNNTVIAIAINSRGLDFEMKRGRDCMDIASNTSKSGIH